MNANVAFIAISMDNAVYFSQDIYLTHDMSKYSDIYLINNLIKDILFRRKTNGMLNIPVKAIHVGTIRVLCDWWGTIVTPALVYIFRIRASKMVVR